MTAITKKRVDKLREWLKTYSFAYVQCAEILTLLSDYEKMRAEIENRCDQRDAALESVGLLSAQLEKQRPLIEAVREVPYDSLRHLVEISHAGANTNTANILRAALKLREGEK